MPLELHPMQESDYDAYEEIAHAAFKEDIMSIMYPNGFTEAAKQHGIKTGIKAWRQHPDTIVYYKVIDTDLSENDANGKMVGASHWKFYAHDRTDEEIEAEKEEKDEEGLPPDCNAAFMEDFFGNIRKYKKQILGGRAHVLLSFIATHPDHHRRGIAGMQIRKGLEEADKLGLPAYLEASPKGRPLYERMGFEKVSDFPFEAKEWGHPRDLPHVCMLRPAHVPNPPSAST